MGVSFLANQVNKRSPLNFRPILGIRPARNPKGLGLFLDSQARMMEEGAPRGVNLLTTDPESEARMLMDWLEECITPGYSGTCWGYNFAWPKKDVGIVPAFTPSSVVTGFVCRALYRFWLQTRDLRAERWILDAANFILCDIPVTDTEYGRCYSYLPVKRDETVNASLMAAEILAYADIIGGTDTHRDAIHAAMIYTVNRQNADGSWYYSFNKAGGEPKKQIDFHQGYVIDSLTLLSRLLETDDDRFRLAARSGLEYYLANQFSLSGAAFWRLPKRWPVDIHNQSQGMLTLSKFAAGRPEVRDLMLKISGYTLEHLQDNSGYFYYQKWPAITNRVSYMRWAQGWMYNALLAVRSALTSPGPG
jgi:hypothetical protein